MPARPKRTKQPDDEISVDAERSPVGRGAIRGELTRPRITLAAGAGDAFPDSIEEVFGANVGDELKARISEVQERESDILAWLAEDPSHVETFVEDPVGVLRTQFPELKLPRGTKPVVPHDVTLELDPGAPADPGLADIFRAIWEYVGASPGNAAAFRAAPFSVIASVGAPFPPDKVGRVVEAFEAALGIHRLQAIDVVRAIALVREVP